MAFYEFLTTCRRAEGAELQSADGTSQCQCGVGRERTGDCAIYTISSVERTSSATPKRKTFTPVSTPELPCVFISENPKMLGLELQNLPMKRDLEVKSASPNNANLLMCRQWWKVCWIYGDQEKYYRQLYGKRQSSSATVITVQKEVSTLCSE